MKDWTESIEIPAQLHARCMQGVQKAARARKIRNLAQKMGAAAAAVILLAGLAAGGGSLAQSVRGYFSDVIRWDGAVVGTEYRQAAQEVNVRLLHADEAGVTVELTFDADRFPWRELETIRPAQAEMAGIEDVTWTAGKVENGRAEIRFTWTQPPEAGEYQIVILDLYGEKKAEQPLKIEGEWRVEFAWQK